MEAFKSKDNSSTYFSLPLCFIFDLILSYEIDLISSLIFSDAEAYLRFCQTSITVLFYKNS